MPGTRLNRAARPARPDTPRPNGIPPPEGAPRPNGAPWRTVRRQPRRTRGRTYVRLPSHPYGA
ncbi:hypothetical protein GCM10027075_55620 [Streptomyces heilongjiangensis]